MAVGDSPDRGSDKYIWSGLSTDTKPAKAFIGQLAIETDTGLVSEWTGAAWLNRMEGVETDPLVKSIPTTSTFHHLGHEGKVFVHSDRHNGLANEGTLNFLVVIPAGDASRQVHMRFGFTSKAVTGTLDLDVVLYKDTTVSANGAEELVVSTNDAVVKTTDVKVYLAPTITDVGTRKSWVMNVGEKKGASNLDQAVPEWVLAPNGLLARNYLFQLTNNSGGVVDIVAGIFFYDTGAA